MTTNVAKINRSSLYHAIASLRPINDARIARLDVLGSVMVPVLLVCVLNIIRLVFVE